MGKYDVSPGNAIPKRPRISDADAQAQLRANSDSLGVSKADTGAYDFESQATHPTETDLHATRAAQAENRVVSYGEPKAASMNNAQTAVFGDNTNLASKAKAAYKPKPIAQAVADVKAPPAPERPLAGQGAKAIEVPKAVQQAGSISDSDVAAMRAAGKVKKAPPLDGPKTPKVQAPAPKTKPPVPEAKVMTSEGAVEPVVKPVGGPKSPVSGKMTAGDLFGEGAPSRITPKMAEGDLFSKPASLGEKFSGSLQGAKALAKGAGSVADDVFLGGVVKGYRELKAARAAGTAAKSGMKAFGQEAAVVGKSLKNVGRGLYRLGMIQYAGQSGYKLGSGAKESIDEAKSEAKSQARQGAKYGLKVTPNDPSTEGSNFLSQTARDIGHTVKIAAGYGDPTVNVTEDPALKAKARARRNKK